MTVIKLIELISIYSSKGAKSHRRFTVANDNIEMMIGGDNITGLGVAVSIAILVFPFTK
jgi:hypothetical protein